MPRLQGASCQLNDTAGRGEELLIPELTQNPDENPPIFYHCVHVVVLLVFTQVKLVFTDWNNWEGYEINSNPRALQAQHVGLASSWQPASMIPERCYGTTSVKPHAIWNGRPDRTD